MTTPDRLRLEQTRAMAFVNPTASPKSAPSEKPVDRIDDWVYTHHVGSVAQRVEHESNKTVSSKEDGFGRSIDNGMVFSQRRRFESSRYRHLCKVQ